MSRANYKTRVQAHSAATDTIVDMVDELLPRAQRSDAKRNRKRIIDAARKLFAQMGTAASLEAIARQAGVGIGTLYRHFPNRQALLEAVYLEEVQSLCEAAGELSEMPPWESFAALTRRLMTYFAAKHALADELLSYVGQDAPFFRTCRKDLFETSKPILERAQAARVVRSDTDILEVVKLVGGIARLSGLDAAQREHMLEIALAGLRTAGD